MPWCVHGEADRIGAEPYSSRSAAVAAASRGPELEKELIRAMEEFERGDYIELTVEQLKHCAATGESPWPDESRD